MPKGQPKKQVKNDKCASLTKTDSDIKLWVDDRGEYYRVFVPIGCKEYLKRLLQHAKEHYVEEFTASTPKEYWAHNKMRQDQVQYIINQLD